MISNHSISKTQKFLIVLIFIIFLVFIVVEFLYIISLLLGLSSIIVLGIPTLLQGLEIFRSVISGFTLFIGLLLIISLRLTENSNVKAIFFNLAFIFIAIGTLEAYLQYDQNKVNSQSAILNVDVSTPIGYYAFDPILGPVPAKNMVAPVIAKYKDEVLFDVTFTIDSNSHRITPPFNNRAGAKSIVFFGCSMTFGYGLEDDEPFPYVTGVNLHGDYKIYNFGFGGYGTHHMLAALEHGIASKIIKVEPEYIIYTAIPDHLRRILNRKSWGDSDPKYILENGEAKYVGSFNQDKSLYNTVSNKVLESMIAGKFFKEQIDNYGIELFGAIVKASRDHAKKLYPNSKFIVIFWGDSYEAEKCRKMKQALTKNGIEIHDIDAMIPKYYTEYQKYQIKPPKEPHPNALACKLIGDYITNKIVHQEP